MKNKEKWAKEIVEITLTGDNIAVLAKTGKPIGCECVGECINCLFFGKSCSCTYELKKWAEEEYIEKPKISKSDRVFLDYLPDDCKFITRDKDGELFIYKCNPEKDTNSWSYESNMFGIYQMKIYFPMVKWEDEEPWLIEDLKKLEVIDKY